MCMLMHMIIIELCVVVYLRYILGVVYIKRNSEWSYIIRLLKCFICNMNFSDLCDILFF